MKRYSVHMTAGAQTDLARLHRWITKTNGEKVANTFLDTMLLAVDELEALPHRGAIPAELEALGMTHIRHIVKSPYRIFYRVDDTAVHILLIVDGRRDFRRVLEQRLLG